MFDGWEAQVAVVARIAFAMLLGGVIGLERELKDRPAGFRTHTLVAGAAAMLTGMGDMMLAQAQHDHDGRVQIDPFRLVEAVIAGVAFIGAGTMIAHRGRVVAGITTAASLLMVAVIGVAVGFGHGWLALLATLLTLAVLSVLAWMERRVSRRSSKDEDASRGAICGSSGRSRFGAYRRSLCRKASSALTHTRQDVNIRVITPGWGLPSVRGHGEITMDPSLLSFLISFSSGLAANLSTESLKVAYQRVFAARPDLERRITHPTSGPDIQAALSEVAGVLEVLAGTGAISINGGIISALRAATFNHQDGSVRIGNSRISSPTLSTGGTGSGTTVIGGNTELRSAGTSIQIGHGAAIVITGNAGIKQT